MALLGALGVMEKIYGSPLFGPGSRLRRVVGVSVGAVIGMFLAIGFTAEEIRAIVTSGRSWQDLMRADPWKLLDGKLGMNDGSEILALLREHLKKRLGDSEITLSELFRSTGVVLVCVSCRLQTATIDFVGPFSGGKEGGSIKVCDAVFDSMRVPPFFEPNFRNEEHVVDGGLLCTNPFAYLEMIGIDPKTSLGMTFVESARPSDAKNGADAVSDRLIDEASPFGSPFARCAAPPTPVGSRANRPARSEDIDLVDYFYVLAYASAKTLERFQRTSVPEWLWDWNVIPIPVEKVGDVELRANPQRLRSLVATGEEAARKFFLRRLLASGLVETVASAAAASDGSHASVATLVAPLSPLARATKLKEE